MEGSEPQPSQTETDALTAAPMAPLTIATREQIDTAAREIVFDLRASTSTTARRSLSRASTCRCARTSSQR